MVPRKVYLLLFILLMVQQNSIAQRYIWPTNASHYITSSFAEYRPGHFHAGIDIKTWGREGYQVYAVRDGYIWRIRVSPYGYGKVIYQKLDTGEIAVYAHLSRFNDELQAIVKREQTRRDRYRISKYFNSNQFPVKQGDVIGYTGSTGIGYPHLHFELRDQYNSPINPFNRGYRIKDRVNPITKAIAIIPLSPQSRVDGDVLPKIIAFRQQQNGVIHLPDTIVVSGKIGLAVQCWDQADDVNNKFAVYRLKFFVDEKLQFSAQYDKFSYGVTHFIDFDRNYRLRARGIGLFQNLFKSKHNQLPFYFPNSTNAGVLFCHPAVDSAKDEFLELGFHRFKIEIYDYWNNVTVIQGNFLVSPKRELQCHVVLSQDTLTIEKLSFADGARVFHPTMKIFGSKFLKRKLLNQTSAESNDRFDMDRDSPLFKLFPFEPNTLIKIVARDTFGVESLPFFYFHAKNNNFILSDVEVSMNEDFYDDYARFEINAKKGFVQFPQLVVRNGKNHIPVKLTEIELNKFIGVLALNPELKGELHIDFSGYDENMAPIAFQKRLFLMPILPESGGELTIDSNNCQITFSPGAVYDPLFLRYAVHETVAKSEHPLFSKLYEFFPQDVLLKTTARVTIKYAAIEKLPQKLAIYTYWHGKWSFIDNRLDTLNHSISANVSGLGAFALLRDIEPPKIIIFPIKKVNKKEGIFIFIAKITDDLSGIENEMSLRMNIDGKHVIAEYDPERKTLKYQNDVPFIKGRHILFVSARDRSGNMASKSYYFHVQ